MKLIITLKTGKGDKSTKKDLDKSVEQQIKNLETRTTPKDRTKLKQTEQVSLGQFEGDLKQQESNLFELEEYAKEIGMILTR